MVIKYDVEKIKSFLSDFYNMTGLTVSFWDKDMNQLAYAPQEMPQFCKLIKESKIGKKRCLMCDKKLIEECNITHLPTRHKCHAKLIDTAVPIIYKEKVVAFVLFGQIREDETERDSNDELLGLSNDLDLDYEKLSKAYKNVRIMKHEAIQSTANILRAAIMQFFTSKSIELTEDDFIEEVNEFLINNIQNELSIPIICKRFQISKNKLYLLWKKHFDITIGDYILKLRMEMAKTLLTNSDEKIQKISVKSGIPDYNYFSKLFKRYYGCSPSEYRKKFPFILEK